MDRKIKDHKASYLKRKARSACKSLGITHTEALNLVAKDHGFTNWENFINGVKPTVKRKAGTIRPAIPLPAVLDYRNVLTGSIIGQHPNRKMTIRRHIRLGRILLELLSEVEYHKRAKNAIQGIRRIMDTWLGNEYNEAELPNIDFNPIYYSNILSYNESMPTESRQMALKRLLRVARTIVDRSYHDCKPLSKLYERFDLALKALEKWPKKIKVPGSGIFRGRVPAGTFVRVAGSKNVGVVFNHNMRSQVIEGYSDSGRFLAGRHEVSVLRKQLNISDFKPMRLYLPYGKWTCEDGSEVLFNRDYCPIWKRNPDAVVSIMKPDQYVKHEHSEYYYDDRTAPYYENEQTFVQCTAILNDWGVGEKPNALIDLFPVAIRAGDLMMLSPKGIS